MTDSENANMNFQLLAFARQHLTESALLKRETAMQKGMNATAANIELPSADDVLDLAKKFKEFVIN